MAALRIRAQGLGLLARRCEKCLGLRTGVCHHRLGGLGGLRDHPLGRLGGARQRRRSLLFCLRTSPLRSCTIGRRGVQQGVGRGFGLCFGALGQLRRICLRLCPDLRRGIPRCGNDPRGLVAQHRGDPRLIELLGLVEAHREFRYALGHLGVALCPHPQRIGSATQHRADLGRLETPSRAAETAACERRRIEIRRVGKRSGHATMLRSPMAACAHGPKLAQGAVRGLNPPR